MEEGEEEQAERNVTVTFEKSREWEFCKRRSEKPDICSNIRKVKIWDPVSPPHKECATWQQRFVLIYFMHFDRICFFYSTGERVYNTLVLH